MNEIAATQPTAGPQLTLGLDDVNIDRALSEPSADGAAPFPFETMTAEGMARVVAKVHSTAGRVFDESTTSQSISDPARAMEAGGVPSLTNVPEGLDYFTVHKGMNRLAVNMLLMCCTTLNSRSNDEAMRKNKQVELDWLNGCESTMSYRFCLNVLGLDNYADRIREQILAKPAECIDHFRRMYLNYLETPDTKEDIFSESVDVHLPPLRMSA